MTLDEFLALFAVVSLVTFAGLATAVLLRMLWRLVAFLDANETVPVLLRRDIILFGTFVAYFGVVLLSRFKGYDLRGNPYWVVPSTVAILLAMGYWVWVEYHLDSPD